MWVILCCIWLLGFALREEYIDRLINGGAGSHYGGFPSFNETLFILNSLRKANPLFVQRFVGGISVECRPLYAYLLTGMGLRESTEVFDTHMSDISRRLARSIMKEDRILVNACANSAPDATFTHLWRSFVSRWRTFAGVDADIDIDFNTSALHFKGTVLLTALHHAREPTSLTVPLHLFHFLVRHLGYWTMAAATRQPEKASRLDNVSAALVMDRDIFFVPFVNPDGYVAIEKQGAIDIRKNRRRTCTSPPKHKLPFSLEEGVRESLYPLTNPDEAPSLSDGVDLNRNYDNHFESAHDRCDAEEYEGPFAFSEPETRTVKRLAEILRPKVALNFHAFGNLWTHPFNCCPKKEFREGDAAIFKEIKESLNITMFGSAPELEVLGYTTTGEADDFLYEEFGVISMSPEVGPEDGGFYPKSNLLRSLNAENLEAALKVIVKSGPQLSASIEPQSCSNSQESGLIVSIFNTGLSDANTGALLVNERKQFSKIDLVTPQPGDHLGLNFEPLTREEVDFLASNETSKLSWKWVPVSEVVKSRSEMQLVIQDLSYGHEQLVEVCYKMGFVSGQKPSKFLKNQGLTQFNVACHCGWIIPRCDATRQPLILAPILPSSHPCHHKPLKSV
eukprot:Gregarina_sp_Poly_1__7830@NODE_443_length_8344_cov_221_121421_g361_i0_p3_GENE_NODE_443_length_8344_cov_221_121421_g361_i0NODE_443_length_8344_cov_221_121421_g361_i0_p3_ORF_typecomplete_len621_score78_26Peptidase_M14/PF00246_24/4_8e38AstE_AspA/PF04952_14/0_00077_NODE_443_length_8344_cov_221_121421_g361_i047866648